jgi:hypothetical protein|tara:strand:+ start:2981 stop:3472 length:492 start_codon:yes stop_codon:yes gene_type:complete
MVHLDAKDTQTVRGVKMLKTLFGQKYSKVFLDRIKFRRAEYYEKRRIQTIRANATKMAYNWAHEYPTGTPIAYIRDDIIECWERSAGVGMYAGLDKRKQKIEDKSPTYLMNDAFNDVDRMDIIGQNGNDGAHYSEVPPSKIKKYVHSWRNDTKVPYKIEGQND